MYHRIFITNFKFEKINLFCGRKKNLCQCFRKASFYSVLRALCNCGEPKCNLKVGTGEIKTTSIMSWWMQT